MRTATVERKTRETEVAVSLNLDGPGESKQTLCAAGGRIAARWPKSRFS